MWIQISVYGCDQLAVVLNQCTAGDDAAEFFVRIFGSVERNGVAAHAVTEEKYRDVRIFFDGKVYKYIGVVEDFVEITVIGSLALGSAVSSVVKAISADPCLMKFLRKVIITPLVLAKTVNNDDRSSGILDQFPVEE